MMFLLRRVINIAFKVSNVIINRIVLERGGRGSSVGRARDSW